MVFSNLKYVYEWWIPAAHNQTFIQNGAANRLYIAGVWADYKLEDVQLTINSDRAAFVEWSLKAIYRKAIFVLSVIIYRRKGFSYG